MNRQSDSNTFWVTWRGTQGIVICECFGQALERNRHGAPPSTTVKILKIPRCRIASGAKSTSLVTDFRVLPGWAQEEIGHLRGKVIVVADNVIDFHDKRLAVVIADGPSSTELSFDLSVLLADE